MSKKILVCRWREKKNNGTSFLVVQPKPAHPPLYFCYFFLTRWLANLLCFFTFYFLRPSNVIHKTWRRLIVKQHSSRPRKLNNSSWSADQPRLIRGSAAVVHALCFCYRRVPRLRSPVTAIFLRFFPPFLNSGWAFFPPFSCVKLSWSAQPPPATTTVQSLERPTYYACSPYDTTLTFYNLVSNK